MSAREHEHTLNVWLAELLRERGLDARQESAQGGRRIDVDVRVGPVKIALEAEQGQSAAKKREAVADADRRLEQGLADCAIAVCYPDGITAREHIPHADLLWNIRAAPPRQICDIANRNAVNWGSGDLDELARIVRLAPMQLGNPDHVAASLSASLDAAVSRLGDTQKRLLAQRLDLPPSKGRGARWDKAAKRSLLVVATAVMFHARLDAHLNALAPLQDNRTAPPAPFSGDWPPRMARDCADSPDPVSAFSDAWNLILALDYRPIFETGRAALHACPADPAFAAAVRETGKAALAVAGNIAGLRHDLMGRIFHTVLDTARYDGSFYTTTAAATLLAQLAVTRDMRDWSAPDALDGLRIVDPACGTGTLLMAAAERIRDLSPRTRDDDRAARTLIENVLSGYDVNLTATHMAATTLGLLSPSTRFRSMKIGRTFLGVDDEGDAYLGSLEFLDQNPKMMSWPNAARAVEQIDGGEEMARPDPADLVIMNPPFTRNSLRHDQFNRSEEKSLRAREKQLFAGEPVHLTSNGNSFVVLAEYIGKTDEGTLAAVLPLTTSTNASSLEIRKFLARKYHVETIVTSYDPERIYFSENTTIGEMLLICRIWRDAKKPKPPTRIVNLAVNPSTPADAINLASAIENGTVESQRYGTVQEWQFARIERGDWGGVQFLSPYLCERFQDLSGGDMFPAIAMSEVADISPDGRGIRGNFTRSRMPGKDGMVALYDHKTDVIRTMSATPDTYIVPKKGKAKQARKLWNQRGLLMLPTRARLNTVRMLSVRLDRRALGSAWVPCKPNIEGVSPELAEKALCVYLNSSVGVLAMLGNRSNKAPSYPQFSMDDLRKLFVPDFGKTGTGAVWTLALAYDALSESEILPLPRMDACPTRRALDEAVCAALGVDAETASEIRRQLSSEPSVTGKRYAGR